MSLNDVTNLKRPKPNYLDPFIILSNMVLDKNGVLVKKLLEIRKIKTWLDCVLNKYNNFSKLKLSNDKSYISHF